MSSDAFTSIVGRIEKLRAAAPAFYPEDAPPTADELWIKRLERCAVPLRFRSVPRSNKPLEWQGWSFVLHGPVGCGKTYQAVSILGHEEGPGFFVDCAVAVELMKQEFGQSGGPRLIERMISTHTLVLDDFGAERLDSEFARDTFSTVIRARYNEEKTTIVTTNLPPEGQGVTLRSLHPALYSRLREGAFVRLKGKDRRAT